MRGNIYKPRRIYVTSNHVKVHFGNLEHFIRSVTLLLVQSIHFIRSQKRNDLKKKKKIISRSMLKSASPLHVARDLYCTQNRSMTPQNYKRCRTFTGKINDITDDHKDGYGEIPAVRTGRINSRWNETCADLVMWPFRRKTDHYSELWCSCSRQESG